MTRGQIEKEYFWEISNFYEKGMTMDDLADLLHLLYTDGFSDGFTEGRDYD